MFHAILLMFFMLLAATVQAEHDSPRVIKVGPGQRFSKLSNALSSARDGDTIEIDSRGDYSGDVCTIRPNKLTIRGVGERRAVFPAAGRNAGEKGIWVVKGDDITIENIEFRGARVRDENGAGIRAEGRNLTIRGSKFHDCENGILGGAGVMTIEYCEFSHCGLNGQAHNLYISSIDRLVFRFNYSHHARAGHLLKSRARKNYIAYNYLTDERDGSSSYVVNFPNGGRSFLIGNILCQSPETNNSTMVAYGEEGAVHKGSALYVVNNTLVNNRHAGVFLNINNVGNDFRMVVRNNIFAGRGTLSTFSDADTEGNFSGEPGFVDAERFDFHLAVGSPCIGKGVEPAKAGNRLLRPRFQYVHPAGKEDRPNDGNLDIGAFEFSRKRR